MLLKIAFVNCRSHGDCAVITFKENRKLKCIVVDGGEDKSSAAALKEYLESEGVRRIDLLVGSHIDSDHINGLKHFTQAQLSSKTKGKSFIAIKEFWGAMPSEENISALISENAPEVGDPGDDISWRDYVFQSVKQNDDLIGFLEKLDVKILYPALDNQPANPFRNVELKVLGPDTQIPADHIRRTALNSLLTIENKARINSLEGLIDAIGCNVSALAERAKRNANNQSIVFRLKPIKGSSRGKGWSFLFTGDAEEEAWEEMVGNNKVARNLKAKVLKIPHHGSALNGITREGVEKVKPRYSVNSVGQKHGLPDEETLSLLRAENSKILCTQRNSDKKKKSACYRIPGNDCPAKNNPDTIVFKINTQSGRLNLTPDNRYCKHNW